MASFLQNLFSPRQPPVPERKPVASADAPAPPIPLRDIPTLTETADAVAPESGLVPEPLPEPLPDSLPAPVTAPSLTPVPPITTTVAAFAEPAPRFAAAAMPDRAAAPLCLYHVHGPLWGDLDHADSRWPTELARVAALGCTHVLLSPPWSPGENGDVNVPADLERLHPALGNTTAAAGIAHIAMLCRGAGLGLMLDLPLAAVARQGAFARQHPDWLAPAPTGCVADPRRADVDGVRAVLRWHDEDGACRDALLAWASAWVGDLVASGVHGFRCLEPAALPPAAWQQVTAAARAAGPDVRFLAWTPGTPAGAAGSLADCGFDAACSSLPWWNGQDAWLLDETARLRAIGRVVAAPEAPFEPRLSPHGSLAVHRRNLWLAATMGDDLLLPMGYEYGASAALNPRHHAEGDWDSIRAAAPFDLSAMVTAATRWMRDRARGSASVSSSRAASASASASKATATATTWRLISAPNAAATAVLRVDADGEALVIAINPSLSTGVSTPARAWLAELPVPAGRMTEAVAAHVDRAGAELTAADQVVLPPAGVRVLRVLTEPPVTLSTAAAGASDAQAVATALRQPRIAIEAITPQCDDGRFPVKRSVGDAVRVEADVWLDGHDQLAVQLRWRATDSDVWHDAPMRHRGNDRWTGDFPLTRIGRHEYRVEAWRDTYGTWSSEVQKKHAAGIDVHLELQEGRSLVLAAASRAAAAPAVTALATRLNAAPGNDDAAALNDLLSPDAASAMRAAADRPHLVQTAAFPIDVERLGARYASWYELFPRSQSPDPTGHGTFDDVIAQLPRVAAMGFDVLYFPPIHPIGRSHRKGPNNSLTAGADDPGSPYAIGSPDGGHTAIHPQLGTLDDFRRLLSAAADHGLEIALDFAIQCSPDHPWLREHPEWFMFRPDGTVKYAENPPKKYEDIVNVDFYSDRAAADGAHGAPGLWCALRDAVLFWADEGVRLFRVDNPHTKPLPFWEWLIGEVRGRYPDAVFLAEAFTRPKMMARLAKVGFSQSYSYFTWRNTKSELTQYLLELNAPPLSDVFRPHFFVNTPDINPHFLHTSGRPGFLIRAALATTLSGLWGMYNGYEVCEGAPHMVGGVAKEEYADSEKYQYRHWDWNQPGNIVGEITRLNAIRRAHPALHSHLNVRFCTAHNDNILFFAKFTEGADPGSGDAAFGDDVVLVAINLDPHHVQEADIEVPLWELGLSDDAPLHLTDLVHGGDTTWHGKYQHVRLDPWQLPYAVWHARPRRSAG